MNSLILIVLVLSVFLAACSDSEIAGVPVPAETPNIVAKRPLELVDISKMTTLAPKGRIQDGKTALGDTNHIAIDLVANGKDSIPFLINQLEDETDMDRHTMNYWYQLYVGDMAHIILTDLFTDQTGMNSTVPGFGWDEFLERGNDKDIMGEEVLRRYIRKHGRRSIQQRWQEMWDQNKDKIFWDEKCRCFRSTNDSFSQTGDAQ